MKKYWDTYLNVFKKDYANFKGTEGQYTYVVFLLFNLAVGIVLSLLSQIFAQVSVMSWIISIISLLFGLFVIIPEIAIFVRRWRDLRLSPWLALLMLLGFPIPIFVIYLAVVKSR
jgi:uncharacterized membrane protein YhaH (DUF805 family)